MAFGLRGDLRSDGEALVAALGLRGDLRGDFPFSLLDDDGEGGNGKPAEANRSIEFWQAEH